MSKVAAFGDGACEELKLNEVTRWIPSPIELMPLYKEKETPKFSLAFSLPCEDTTRMFVNQEKPAIWHLALRLPASRNVRK